MIIQSGVLGFGINEKIFFYWLDKLMYKIELLLV